MSYLAKLLLVGIALSAQAAPADPADAVGLAPREQRVNGGLALIALDERDPVPPYFAGRPVWHGQVGGRRMAVVGLPLDLEPLGGRNLAETPGEHGERLLTLSDADGNPLKAPFRVLERSYPEQHITLPTSTFVTLSEPDQARFAREAAEQKAAYQVFSPQTAATWPPFQWPHPGPLSSAFGLRRFFNGEPRAPHMGLDIVAASGAPIVAPAAGRVALTGDYFFNGRTVIIDHGQGLFSMLCHMSRIDVTAGQTLARGDRVGTVGATGRATGPHLHWTVSLNDVRIDPTWLLPPR